MPTNEGFTVHAHNPNDKFGGGGCLAIGAKANEDCHGPWINLFRVQTEDHASPYAVICAYHLARITDEYHEDEVLTEGDPLPMRPATPVTEGVEQFAGVAGVKVGGDADIDV